MKKEIFKGGRPISEEMPHLEVSGFTLDTTNQKFNPGDWIPAGTLLSGDEQTRLAKVLKSATVEAVDGTSVTLKSDEYIQPIFCIGESVLKAISGTFASAPTITNIDKSGGKYVITLSAEISGLAKGDSIVQVIENTSNNAALISPFTYLVPVDTKVEDGFPTSIGGADRWKVYMRRIPPIPSTLVQDPGKGFPAYLKANPEIKLSKTF